MDNNKVINDILSDIEQLSLSNPNERLPKEEQIRSRMYASLIDKNPHVSVERGYKPIEEGDSSECDIWLRKEDGSEAWIEIKRCWSGKGFFDKPQEQLTTWNADIFKLSNLPVNTDRYFILAGIFEHDPKKHPSKSKVISNVNNFYKDNQIAFFSRSMHWRNSSINFVCCWCYRWKHGEII